MTARLIVDGNNVMGSRPDGWWRDRPGATRRLIEQLGRWAAHAQEEVLVVFDGRRPEGLTSAPAVEVRFAERAARDAADDVIAALVAAAVTPAELEVVTSDAALVERVRRRGAKVTGSGGFRDRLERLGG
jgi:predicted RNA-binding protein with PIN domain